MIELNSINISLVQLEKLLYGLNYEVHFQFEYVCESTEIQKAGLVLAGKYEDFKLNLDAFIQVPFIEFKDEIIRNFKYDGMRKRGSEIDKIKNEEFERVNDKLWHLISQKFLPSQTLVFRIPSIQRWIFWDFCFLVVSKDRNKIYLFEGGASD